MPNNIIDLQALLSSPKKSDNLILAFQMSGIGVWDFSFQHKLFKFDSNSVTLLGLTDNKLTYDQFLKTIIPQNATNFDTVFQNAISKKYAGNVDVIFKINNPNTGSLKSLRFIGSITFDEKGLADNFTGCLLHINNELDIPDEMRKLKVLVDNSPDLMGISGNNGIIQYVNQFGKKMLGIDDNFNFETISPADFYPSTEVERMQMIYQEIKEKGQWHGHIFLRHFKSGETIPGYASFESVIDPTTNEILGRSVTVRDIRKDIITQKALKANENLFRNVTENAPTGLWMSDTEGKLVYLNKTLVDWTGIPYSDLLGNGWANAIIDEDREKSGEIFLSAVKARAHYDVEFRINKSDGTICWCRAAGDPYYNENGEYAGYTGFCMDIHQHVEMSNKVLESEERIKSIVEQAPIAIGVLRGEDLIVESGNKAILNVWGKNADIIGLPIIEALPEIKGQGFVELLQNVYKTGIPFNGNSIMVKLEHNGEIKDVYVDFVYAPIKNSNNVINGILVLASDVTNKVLANKAASESELKFRKLIEDAPVATCVFTGREMKIEIANDIMIGYWGKGNSVLGKNIAEALPELKEQSFLKLLDNVFTTGETFEAKGALAELEVDGKMGTYYFDFTYKAMRNHAGEIYGVMNMSVDVTERVLATRTLEESEQFSRTVFNESPIAKIVYTGGNMTIRDVNENMLKIFGRETSTNFVGKPLMEAVPELAKTPLFKNYQRVLTTGEMHVEIADRIELIKYGQSYWGYYDYIYKPLRKVDGEIYGVMCTAVEVTDQVMARQKLEDTENRLRAAIELAGLATWSYHADSKTFSYSNRFMEWLGFSEDTKGIDDAYNPLPDEYRQTVPNAIAATMAKGSNGTYDFIHPIINRTTGQQRVIHAQGQVFYDADGEPLVLRGTAQDITIQQEMQMALSHEVQLRTEELAAAVEELQSINEEIARTNEELEEVNQNLNRSNEELSQYAYVASHDLQEPLRKIRVFSGILSNQKSLSPENKIFVDKIDSSSARMSLLIKDLLEFSKLVKSEDMVRPVDLNQTAKEVITDFELIISEKKANITVDKLPLIEAVGLQMNQLFYNVIGNALKFVEKDVTPVIHVGSKKISFDEVKQYIQKPKTSITYYDITIQDNGIGFDSKYSDQIFEVFKRLHGKDIYPGSGIGLALCRRIVNNHGGHLYSQSEPGKGTIFHIILPVSS